MGFPFALHVVPGGWRGGCCEDGVSLCLLGDGNTWPMPTWFMGILGQELVMEHRETSVVCSLYCCA